MAQKTPRELRKFGLTVGGVFLLLGAVSRWRGHVFPPLVLWTLGGLLAGSGLVAPALLGPVERGWMRFAEALAFVNTRIILGALFYALVTPVGWVRRRGRDPMNRRLGRGEASDWIPRDRGPVDPARYRQQF